MRFLAILPDAVTDLYKYIPQNVLDILMELWAVYILLAVVLLVVLIIVAAAGGKKKKLKSENARLVSELGSKDAEIEKVKQQYIGEYEDVLGRNRALTESLASVQAENEELTERCNGFDSEMSAKNEQIEEHEGTIGVLAEQVAELEAERDQLLSRVAEKESAQDKPKTRKKKTEPVEEAGEVEVVAEETADSAEEKPVKKTKAKPKTEKAKTEQDEDDTKSAKPKAEKADKPAKSKATTDKKKAAVSKIEELDYTVFLDDGEEAMLFEYLLEGDGDSSENDAEGKAKAPREAYIVKFDRPKNSWVILKKGQERAVRRLNTKEEALKEARALCKKRDAGLTVHKKDGKFQKVR